MIAARQIFLGRGGAKVPTAADYVQTGLVAIWDGIENAGWGVHDSAATACKDLISGLEKPCTTFDTYFRSTSAKYFSVFNNSGDHTIEVCSPFSGYGSRVYSSANSNDTGFCAGILGTSLTYGNIAIRYRESSGLKTYYAFSKSSSRGVVVVVDSTNGVYRIYQNGEYYVNRSGTPNAVNYVAIEGGTINYLEINCLRIYNRALTAAEIAANCTIDKARFNQA